MGKVAADPMRLEIRLFGHLEVALDGVRFDLATPRKSLQVLTYLLLHRSAAVSREYLAFLLYPDDEEGSARAKLRATLSDLVKILPGPAGAYVSIDSEKVGWNPEADLWLDVDAFEAAARDRARLDEAIDLYRGDLLPAVYDEWLEVIRERYRNTHLRCLGERISEARRIANFGLAIETARRLLAVDPWREDVARRIIAMRYESGDAAGALSEYTRFAKRLRAEMGTEPMPETVAVAERVRRGQALAPDDETERAEIADASAVLPFVGRRDEMERLLETWTRVARGRGGCAFVGGEAGIGKSRIVLEFARAVEERGGRVLVGTTSSPEAIPYEAVVDALRSALPLLASLKPGIALACVASLVPEIHARVTLPDPPRLDGESERIRLFESLFRCVADLAAPRPLLLVLEDMHGAQRASIELLEALLRRITAVAVMILVTYRDEETPRLHALQRLRREARSTAGAQSLWLSPLSVADVEILRATLPDLRDRPAETLVTASQGNPLFLTQLAVEAGEGEQAAAPASLHAAVARRIERLSESARTAAEISACIGDRFSRDALREVSAWDDPSLTAALDELLDRRIIREAGGRGFLEYAFTHQLVHDAIAQAMPPDVAGVRRRRVARVLEELYPERVPELSAILAGHYQSAGDATNATRCYLQAIRRSISIGAIQEARTQSDRALKLDVDSRARAELLLERTAIESRSGDRDAWLSALLALERIDSELGDPAGHRAALLARIEFASTAGDRDAHDRAVRALRECVPDDDPRIGVLRLAEAKLDYALGRLSEAYACGEAALSSARTAGDEVGTVNALCSMAEIETHRGHLSAAETLFDEAAQVAARAADPVLELLALRSGLAIAYQRRDIARCHAIGTRCLELAVRLGDRLAEAQAHGRLAIAFAAEGSGCAKAREHFAAAGRIYGESGSLTGTAGQLMNQAVLENKLGFVERALTATEEAVALFERARDARGQVAALANLVFLCASSGRIDAARKAGAKALDLAHRQGFELIEASLLENLASAEGAAGDYRRAIELAEASFDLRSRSDSRVWSGKTLADVAIWHAALENLPAARDAVQRMLADHDAIIRGTDSPSYCYWVAAQIFHLDGDTQKAARALEQARKLMQASAGGLEVEDREHFLALRWHVDLLRAATSGAWPNPPR